jgi:hypothetical protein
MNEPDPYRPYDVDLARIDYLWERGEFRTPEDIYIDQIYPKQDIESSSFDESSEYYSSGEETESDNDTSGKESCDNEVEIPNNTPKGHLRNPDLILNEFFNII